jgi:hypothetical protein
LEALGNLNKNISLAKHKAIVCLNYVEELVRKGKGNLLAMVELMFIRMEKKGINVELLLDNFINVNNVLISKKIEREEREERIEHFVIKFSSPCYLHHYPSNTSFFLLLNKLLLKCDCAPTLLLPIFTNLVTYLSNPQAPSFNLEVLPFLTHSLAHLVLVNPQLPVNGGFVEGIIEMVAGKEEEEGTDPAGSQRWYMFLLLHFVYCKAENMRAMMVKGGQYNGFMVSFFSTKLSNKI